jgi:excisionase family DNA binding protein
MAKKGKATNGTGPVYYTTFQVAKFLGVSLPTIVNWVEAGRLEAHKTPGGHRRIAQRDLIAFARSHRYPISAELAAVVALDKVLVVDDEVDFAELVREYLQLKGGYQVEVASSGFDAGFAVARFQPDLILMDIMMPDMDGFQVHELLKSDPATRHIPVIACTAYRDPEIEARIRKQTFDGFLEKPLKLDALLEAVKAALAIETRSDGGAAAS